MTYDSLVWLTIQIKVLSIFRFVYRQLNCRALLSLILSVLFQYVYRLPKHQIQLVSRFFCCLMVCLFNLFLVEGSVAWYINERIHVRWQHFWQFIQAFTDLIYCFSGPLSQMKLIIYCFPVWFTFFAGLSLTMNVFKIWLRRAIHRLPSIRLKIHILKAYEHFFRLLMKREGSRELLVLYTCQQTLPSCPK